MIVKKYLHSCLLLEDHGKKLLIDPGAFSFIENKLKPEDIGPVDVILITHKHWDHYHPPALKILMSLKPARIVTNEEIVHLLKQEGLESEIIRAGETKEIEGFKVKALAAPHGPIPSELPQNLAFLINDTLLHPGDSLHMDITHCRVLALPTTAPWSTLVEALELAMKLKPEIVIPIHDVLWKDFVAERMHGLVKNKLEAAGISFHPLNVGEPLHV